MKICMLTNTYRPHVGGVAGSVSTLVEECRGAGHDVRVVAPGFPGDQHETDPGVLRVPAWQRFNGSDFSVPVPLPHFIASELADFEPEIVHSHHPFLLGDAALRWSYAHHVPLIFTHHTLYENYTHYVPLDSPALKRFVIHLATAYANCCDAVIAPSQGIADLLRSRGVESRIEVIPTGIDTRAFAGAAGDEFRRARGIPADALVLGHVGRLAQEKNLDFLGESVARWLQGRVTTAGFCWWAMGRAVRRCSELFERAGVSQRVLMTGKLTGSTLCDAYAAMDGFAFASLTETQGMVVAEAMAAGLPVIALDGPGVGDVVVDGENGRLLASGSSVADFAAALEQGMDESTLGGWRAAARETASAFDRSTCARSVMDLYQTLGGKQVRERSGLEVVGSPAGQDRGGVGADLGAGRFRQWQFPGS
ncbi:MAG: glycosyltransferase [Halofilum sp. (in: g-proteobacteria)]|nr:glycosyltransferase [Halofilum sp. (in: g-proteobacteria)]